MIDRSQAPETYLPDVVDSSGYSCDPREDIADRGGIGSLTSNRLAVKLEIPDRSANSNPLAAFSNA
jgi:hypothetical protein